METREDDLLRLATALDAIGADQKLIIRERYFERAFGNTRALAMQRREYLPGRMAARFVTTASSAKESLPVLIRQAAAA
ncbi:hypothetical protein ABIF63_000412 [Bradyrhizobium japonicum]|uniref:Uncharacterized protein n=1 Tax=Bradyrhizobium japonicum TaxID=375 RepID=A0ABV2RHA5_BRAJP